MFRRLLILCSVVAAFSGCFDFDRAYESFCDAGHCTATGGGTQTGGGGAETGGGGGTETGGGTGGGTETDGGTGGGGGGGSQPIDAGCPDALCPTIDWRSTRVSSWYEVAQGVLAESVDKFTVYASFEVSNSYNHYEYRFVDGGMPTELGRSNMPTNVESRQIRGVSLSDYWLVSRLWAMHIAGGIATPVYDCTQADGGEPDGDIYAVYPVSADEVWMTGFEMGICKWTSATGAVQVLPPPAEDSDTRVYLQDIYHSPAGETFAVGGNYYATGGSPCLVYRENGDFITTPDVLDHNNDGCISINGVGDDVYIAVRSNSNLGASAPGQVLKLDRNATGGPAFVSVYTAPYELKALDVASNGEVWAFGDSAGTVVHFDGTTWGTVVLPLTENSTDVRWEALQVTDDGLMLSGRIYDSATSRNTAVVNAYRLRGH